MTSDDRKIIQQIEEARDGTQFIPVSLVRQWMSCSGLEVQGALTSFLLSQSGRIEPSLSWEEVCVAFENYYKQCLIRDLQQNDYVPNRYIAGYELVNWFMYLWKEPSAPREYVIRLKIMLRDLYLENEPLRSAIVNAVMEHLFEVQEIQDFFAEWKSNPKLSNAFNVAKAWGDDHLAKSQ